MPKGALPATDGNGKKEQEQEQVLKFQRPSTTSVSGNPVGETTRGHRTLDGRKQSANSHGTKQDLQGTDRAVSVAMASGFFVGCASAGQFWQ